MLSRNEWDVLQHVIVGSAQHARVPVMDISLRTVNYSNVQDLSTITAGPYPQAVIDVAEQELDQLATCLTDLGVTVSRPDTGNIPEYYYYCPRDLVVVHGDIVIEAPMALRARAQESQCLRPIFAKLPEKFSWLQCHAKRSDDLYDLASLGDPDRLALTESEPAFDAANVIRANDDVFYLVSNSGNRAGGDLLQRLLGDQRRVWPIQGVYSYMHIDSTIALLREGLMLLNPSRVRDLSQLPPPLRSWDVIWAPYPEEKYHWPGYCNSSSWINVNLLSVNPNLVIMEQGQDQLARQLDAHGIDSIQLPMTHSRTLGGSFHCVTLDLVRQHQ